MGETRPSGSACLDGLMAGMQAWLAGTASCTFECLEGWSLEAPLFNRDRSPDMTLNLSGV